MELEVAQIATPQLSRRRLGAPRTRKLRPARYTMNRAASVLQQKLRAICSMGDS
jgi:hypothetical protein